MLKSILAWETRQSLCATLFAAAAVLVLLVGGTGVVLLHFFPSRTAHLVLFFTVLPLMAVGIACGIVTFVHGLDGTRRDLEKRPWHRQPW